MGWADAPEIEPKKGKWAEAPAIPEGMSAEEYAQSLGGGVGAFASNDGLVVSADALASNADAMLGLLAEVVRTANFPEQEIALAKANALQGLKAGEKVLYSERSYESYARSFELPQAENSFMGSGSDWTVHLTGSVWAGVALATVGLSVLSWPRRGQARADLPGGLLGLAAGAAFAVAFSRGRNHMPQSGASELRSAVTDRLSAPPAP